MSTVPPSPNSAPAPYGYGAVPAQDPGKTIGVVGLILAIVAPLIGLIVSIIAFRKSKAAQFNNGLAKAGIAIGSVLTALALIGGIIGGIALARVASTCADLGPGIHQQGGTTYTCG